MTIHAAKFMGHVLTPMCGATGDLTMTHGKDLSLSDCEKCQEASTDQCSWCEGVGFIYDYENKNKCGHCRFDL